MIEDCMVDQVSVLLESSPSSNVESVQFNSFQLTPLKRVAFTEKISFIIYKDVKQNMQNLFCVETLLVQRANAVFFVASIIHQHQS